MVSFTREFDPAHGEAVEVAPGVRRATARNPGPFTFHGTNTYLVGTRRVAVIDPGPALEEHAATLDRALQGATVAAVVVTHRHLDHTEGAAAFARRHDAPLMAHPAPEAETATAVPANRIDAARDRALPVDQPLDDGDVVRDEDFALEALHTPGHASDHLCLALAGTDILFSADHVMGWSTTVVAPPDGSMADYMASLERLMGRKDALFLPGHGGPVTQPQRFMRGLYTHRRQRETGILERLQAGDRTIPEIVARLYQGVDPRLHGAAALSVLAHMQDLVVRGLVLAEGPLTVDGTYRPA